MTEKRQANKKIKKDTARQIALEVICAVAGSLRSWSMVP